jgi:hypothetical protein
MAAPSAQPCSHSVSPSLAERQSAKGRHRVLALALISFINCAAWDALLHWLAGTPDGTTRLGLGFFVLSATFIALSLNSAAPSGRDHH